MVSLHAANRGVRELESGAAKLADRGKDAIDGKLASRRVPHDAAFADVFATGLELRLNENDGGSLPRLAHRRERGENGGQDEGRGDEGNIHDEYGGCGRVAGEELGGREQPGIRAFAQTDAQVAAQRIGDLAIAGVDGKDVGCTVLQEAVGESPGGGADVDAVKASDRNVPKLQGVLQFETAAAHVSEVGAEQADRRLGVDECSGFVDALLGDEDAAGKNEGLGALAGSGMLLVDEKFIQANLHPN